MDELIHDGADFSIDFTVDSTAVAGTQWYCYVDGELVDYSNNPIEKMQNQFKELISSFIPIFMINYFI